MGKLLKKSFSMTLMMLVLVMAMSTSAFASTPYNYDFYYQGNYHKTLSSYIAADATVSDGNVTIKLTGNFFPQVEVDGVVYAGSYNAGTNLTTLVLPGSYGANIPIKLKMIAGPINRNFNLELYWK
ncbi:hypothetical protein [Paenibacillus sp. L3-i20]|uniref:hypothetical protein n=1 Tax=Paenibacillus sp. L3-i20 TaxID=2905833 RepID=UPI001EDE9524|nr:hypothetical protein [Paenibacillus sp. L3-i20]GKU76761.1 hypothetical protein L3i20_v211580 [Paenibacillus sp. L3-i20]